MFGRAKCIVDEIDADRAYAKANPPECGNCRFWFDGWCRRYPPPFPPSHKVARCGEYSRLWPTKDETP